MSTHVLPMMFFNLGGEMLYVLDQRLRAQNIPLLKGKKVVADIVSTMFSKKFTEELFRSQSMYSKSVMHTVFDRLVHSSVMRIDTDSMEKLYDLMVMTFKYQILRCRNPQDLLHITLNHLDAILEFVSSSLETKKLVSDSFRRTVTLYDGMSIGEFVTIRQMILNFFRDSRNRVSVFVNSKSQKGDGTFVLPTAGAVPCGSDVPGTIRYFSSDAENEMFATGAHFSEYKVKESSTTIGGERSVKLGTNLYSNGYGCEQLTVQESRGPSNQGLAKAELGLLGHLMGASSSDPKDCFKMDLFTKSEDIRLKASSVAANTPVSHNVVTIKAQNYGSKELEKIVDDFKVTSEKAEDSSSERDLLFFMDNA